MPSNTYNAPASDPTSGWSQRYSHNNGTPEEMLARLAIQEICLGWPVYRDHSRWDDFKELFTDDATVFTTWSGGVSIDDFVKVSKEGRAKGDFILHEAHGVLALVNLPRSRGVGTMKTTISQRFRIDGIDVDVECNNTFFFFCLLQQGKWKAQYYKVIYEKDRVLPADGQHVPTGVFDRQELEKYTVGYQYLGTAQMAVAGHEIDKKLATFGNGGFERMYEAVGKWLEGESVDIEKV